MSAGDDDSESRTIPFADEPEVRKEIAPGHPRPENVFFVLLGAILTILTFLRGFGLI